MEQTVSIGLRLRDERQRLDLSQTAFAEKGGVTKKTQMLYEAGERFPDAAYLAAVAQIGADIQYIVTGQRQGQGIGESAVHRAVLDAVDLLSLGKKLDVEQLANAVVKLCARNSPPPITPSSQVFHGQVGQAIKVEGDLDQSGISFFGGKKGRK